MSNLFCLDRKSEEIIGAKVFNFQRSDADLVLSSVLESKDIEKEKRFHL